MNNERMSNQEKNLLAELYFLYGVRFLKPKTVVVKGWNTLSAKEINRLAKERLNSKTR